MRSGCSIARQPAADQAKQVSCEEGRRVDADDADDARVREASQACWIRISLESGGIASIPGVGRKW